MNRMGGQDGVRNEASPFDDCFELPQKLAEPDAEFLRYHREEIFE
jgi:hypothetical protein